MAGLRKRAHASTAGLNAAQNANVALGFIELTQAPYNLAPGQAAATNALQLQQAVDDAYSRDLRVMMKGNATGAAVEIDRAIFFHQGAIPAGIGGQGGGGASSLGRAHSLVGRRVNGFKPHIKLKDGVGITNYDYTPTGNEITFGQRDCMFYWRLFDTNQSDNNLAASQYSATFRDFKLSTGSNPTVTGLNMAGAQCCLVADVDIDATGGFASMWDCPGSGGSTANVTFTGGQYGLINTDFRPTPHLNGCIFQGQTVASVVNLNTRNGITFHGCEFYGSAAGYNAYFIPQNFPTASGTGTFGNQSTFSKGNGAFVDCIFDLTGSAAGNTAIDCYDSLILLLNCYIRAGKSVRTGWRQTAVELEATQGQFIGVRGWANGLDSIPAQSRANAQTFTNSFEWQEGAIETNPTLPTRTKMREIWSWPDGWMVNPVDGDVVYLTGTPDDETADNGPALNQLIANAVNGSHPDFGKPIVIPRGFWSLKEPVIVKSGVVLLGIGQSQSILQASVQWLPSSPTDLIRVEAGSGETALQELALNIFEAKSNTANGDLRNQKNICILSVQGKIRAAAIAPCRHEFYGSGDDLRWSQPMARFTGDAHGIIIDLPLNFGVSNGAKNELTVEAPYCLVEIIDKTSDKWLRTYCNPELAEVTQCKVINSPRVYMNFKCETKANTYTGHAQALSAADSPALVIVGTSGLMGTDGTAEAALFDIKNCPGFFMAHMNRQGSTGNGKFNIRVAE